MKKCNMNSHYRFSPKTDNGKMYSDQRNHCCRFKDLFLDCPDVLLALISPTTLCVSVQCRFLRNNWWIDWWLRGLMCGWARGWVYRASRTRCWRCRNNSTVVNSPSCRLPSAATRRRDRIRKWRHRLARHVMRRTTTLRKYASYGSSCESRLRRDSI